MSGRGASLFRFFTSKPGVCRASARCRHSRARRRDGISRAAPSARAALAVGEVVFNTAMTGYQEILTDPSYCRQIVTLTYPHIGNTGVNAEDEESAAVLRRRPGDPRPAARCIELAQRSRPARLPAGTEHRRHRRHRHAQAHAHPARQGRAERLPDGRATSTPSMRLPQATRVSRPRRAWTSPRW